MRTYALNRRTIQCRSSRIMGEEAISNMASLSSLALLLSVMSAHEAKPNSLQSVLHITAGAWQGWAYRRRCRCRCSVPAH